MPHHNIIPLKRRTAANSYAGRDIGLRPAVYRLSISCARQWRFSVSMATAMGAFIVKKRQSVLTMASRPETGYGTDGVRQPMPENHRAVSIRL
jgi:hypothetical protein